MNNKINLVRLNEMINLRTSGKTLQEIGDIYGITKERVRQIVGYIKREKKHHLTKEGQEKKYPLTKEERIEIKKVKSKKILLSHVETKSETECWEWTGYKDSNGYGRFSGGNYVHRAIYEMYFGEIPKEMSICHTCDNPSCCNPQHLFLGTHKDNMHDRDKKGRGKLKKGMMPNDLMKNRILALDQAKLMRIEYKTTDVSISHLARKYGVSYTIAHRIIRNKSYKA